MAAATDYLQILGDLGIDTDQSGPRQANSGRILKGKDGQRYSGIYLNRQAGITYFAVNPGAATVEIDWNLWQAVPTSVSVPRFDLDKHNIVPKPGQEQRALRSLLGMSSGGGFLNFLKGLFGG